MSDDRNEMSRVLYELSINESGELEVRLDREMPPTLVLAVLSALGSSQEEIKRCISWGGSNE